jgi:hypothetical protein
MGLKTTWLKMSVFVISAVPAAGAGVQGHGLAELDLSAQGAGLLASGGRRGRPGWGGVDRRRWNGCGGGMEAVLIGAITDMIVRLGLLSLGEYSFVARMLVVAGIQARGNMLIPSRD